MGNKKAKQDLTINQYATQLRSYMVGKTQVEIQNAIGLWRGSLSALLRGVSFPSQEKVIALLEY